LAQGMREQKRDGLTRGKQTRLPHQEPPGTGSNWGIGHTGLPWYPHLLDRRGGGEQSARRHCSKEGEGNSLSSPDVKKNQGGKGGKTMVEPKSSALGKGKSLSKMERLLSPFRNTGEEHWVKRGKKSRKEKDIMGQLIVQKSGMSKRSLVTQDRRMNGSGRYLLSALRN